MKMQYFVCLLEQRVEGEEISMVHSIMVQPLNQTQKGCKV